MIINYYEHVVIRVSLNRIKSERRLKSKSNPLGARTISEHLAFRQCVVVAVGTNRTIGTNNYLTRVPRTAFNIYAKLLAESRGDVFPRSCRSTILCDDSPQSFRRKREKNRDTVCVRGREGSSKIHTTI